jgi:hypothetical protein
MGATVETGGSQDEKFTVNKFQECVEAWRDTMNCPTGMLNILRRAEVFDFMFGPFHFENDEIDMAIANYDDIAMELKLFGQSVYLDVDFLQEKQKFHAEGEQHLTPKKTPR